MVDKIQDLNLPTTVVTRLIKEALPDGINIGKEARSAIARAASIFSEWSFTQYHPNTYHTFPLYKCQFKWLNFILFPLTVIYLTSSTAIEAKKQKHKSLSADNVFSALEEIEFENFIEPLREALEAFRKANKEKKSSKNESKTTNDTSAMNTADEDMDDDMNETAAQEPTDGTEIEE